MSPFSISSPVIIAIDGPSASGKSSVSKLVALALGYRHVDTGSMYRAFTWKVLQEKIDPSDTPAVLQLKDRIQYECDFVENEKGLLQLRNRLDGKDPGEAIRTPEIEKYVSIISAIPQVREWLVGRQRKLADFGDLVMEGRDIGTVVFSQTPYKFYLHADPEVRAKRRVADQTALGIDTQVQTVSQAITKRDHLDSTRAVAPLKVADDAVRIDTSTFMAQDTADLILKQIRSKYLSIK